MTDNGSTSQINFKKPFTIEYDATAVESCTVERIGDFTASHWTPSASPVLAEHTTFRIGGPASEMIVATTDDELVAAVKAADEAGKDVLIVSGGSNMLVADEGFDGVAIQVATRGISAEESDCGGAFVRVKAGEVWDDFVATAIEREWIGIEALSGIPGLVGATPIQNVGAYGQEVSQTLARVRTWDREKGEYKTFVWADCDFAYRDSIFKRSAAGKQTGRYVVLEVWFNFKLGSMSAPVAYKQLANELGIEIGERAKSAEVRAAVLKLRASKGMVLDPQDHDSWSAGSFFTNPIVDAEVAAALPEDAPKFPQPDGRVKSSAAWLIDHAGFQKGYPGEGPATLSTKHVLALTNRGQASAADVVALARTVRDGVREAWGISLVPEPVFVGMAI